MSFSPRFYRACAICSFISAVTTLGLIFLPKFYGPATDIDARVALIHHPLWQLRAWIYLFHPFLTLAAALGVAVALRRTAAGAILTGFLGFLLWGFTEAGQQTLTLTLFRRLAAAYPGADSTHQEIIRMQIETYDHIWDAMFLLLLIAFLIANVLYGVVTIRGTGVTRTLGFFYFAAAVLTLSIIFREIGIPALPPALEAWFYPATQPVARFLIGVWLWQKQNQETTDS